MFKILVIILALFSKNSYSTDGYIFPSQMSDESEPIMKNTDNRDPFESLNRKVFKFNNYLEKIFLKPITLGYRKVFPQSIQKGVNNIIYNLTVPLSMVNALLIGNVNDSLKCFWKFILNTSFGLAGFYNFTDLTNLSVDDYNFSETMKYYKFPQGPYLILPILGPSNLRGVFGISTDTFLDPIFYIFNGNFNKYRIGLTIINSYSNKIEFVDKIERNSLDAYSTIKSLYLQNRDFNNNK